MNQVLLPQQLKTTDQLFKKNKQEVRGGWGVWNGADCRDKAWAGWPVLPFGYSIVLALWWGLLWIAQQTPLPPCTSDTIEGNSLEGGWGKPLFSDR